MQRPLALLTATVIAGATLLGACGSSESSLSTEEYCSLVSAYKDEGDAFDTLFSGTDSTPADLKAAFDKMKGLINDLAAKAPAEIKADVTTVASATNELIDLLAEYDYDFMAMATDPEATAALEAAMAGADADAASERLSTWSEVNCGISTES